jgi:uncharacterized coiled-coil DUF342 family protein
MSNYDWVAIAGAIVTVLTSITAIIISISKRRKEAKKEDVELSDEETNNIIKYWKDYAKQREAIHKQDMQNVQLQLTAHKNEIIELRESERECQIKVARQEEQLQGCHERINELENRLREKGVLDK